MFKDFIEKLQNSDEAAKIRWLIVLSAIAMAIIVGLWLFFLNVSVEKVGSIKAEESGIGFWLVFKTGMKAVGESIAEKIKILVSPIIGERTITISP